MDYNTCHADSRHKRHIQSHMTVAPNKCQIMFTIGKLSRTKTSHHIENRPYTLTRIQIKGRTKPRTMNDHMSDRWLNSLFILALRYSGTSAKVQIHGSPTLLLPF